MKKAATFLLFLCISVLLTAQKTEDIYTMQIGEAKVGFVLKCDSARMAIYKRLDRDETIVSIVSEHFRGMKPNDTSWRINPVTLEEEGAVLMKDSMFNYCDLSIQHNEKKNINTKKTFSDTVMFINPVTLEETMSLSTWNVLSYHFEGGKMKAEDLVSLLQKNNYLSNGRDSIPVSRAAVYYESDSKQDFIELTYPLKHKQTLSPIEGLKKDNFVVLIFEAVASDKVYDQNISASVLVRIE